jgi:hypothetical protein
MPALLDGAHSNLVLKFFDQERYSSDIGGSGRRLQVSDT